MLVSRDHRRNAGATPGTHHRWAVRIVPSGERILVRASCLEPAAWTGPRAEADVATDALEVAALLVARLSEGFLRAFR